MVMTDNRENETDEKKTFYMYIGFFCGLVILGSLRALSFFAMSSLASQNLHDTLFSVLLRAPIRFYDKNPVGLYLCCSFYY